MDRYSLSPKLTLGVPEIDAQHEKISNMLGALAYALSKGDVATPAYRLEEITAYTEAHFRDEELLLAKAGYLGLAEHKRQHAYLAAQLRDLKDQLARVGGAPDANLADSLWIWFGLHVMRADRVAADWVCANTGSGRTAV